MREGVTNTSGEVILVGEDPGFKEILDAVRELQGASCSVLITGERGTGKTLVARALHERGSRSGNNVVTLHGSVFSDPGSGLVLDGKGGQGKEDGVEWLRTHLNRAYGGTLLIEEIGLLPLRIQAECVNLLRGKGEEGSGDNNTCSPPDIRILATSSGDVEDLVRKQLFHKDLFEHVAQRTIPLPPLRKVPGNVASLTEFFLVRASRRVGREVSPTCDLKAAKSIRQYPWPGNVQELQQELERLVATCPRQVITDRDLSDCIRYYMEPTLNGLHFPDSNIFQTQSFVLPIV